MKNQEDIIYCMAIFLIVMGVLLFTILQPMLEANSYSHLTGKKVSYWDAVWCDLRIQEGVKETK